MLTLPILMNMPVIIYASCADVFAVVHSEVGFKLGEQHQGMLLLS